MLDRKTNSLVPCTKSLCPYSEPYTFLPGQGGWVNRAPYPAFGGWTGGVSSRAPPEAQKAAFQFFAYITR